MRPPCLLAFDTATEVCSVALARAGGVIERSEHVGQRHSQFVLPMAQQLLAEAGATLADLDALAFGAGPGSFTGLRIACGVAQGLAYGIDRPVVPVGNLAALALNAAELAPLAFSAAGGVRRIAVAIDARMQQVYWAVYELRDGDAVELSAPALAAAAELPALIDHFAPQALAGDALAVFAPALQSAAVAQRLPQARAGAGAIARLACIGLARGRALPAAQAMPLYVRDRVALTIDERHAASAAGARAEA